MELEAMYLIHNTTRDVSTRSVRKGTPGARFGKVFVGDYRILPKRYATVPRSVLLSLAPRLLELGKMGAVKVTTQDRRLVDLVALMSGTVVEGPAVPAPVEPHVLPDVIANDEPSGAPVAIVTGGSTLSDLIEEEEALEAEKKAEAAKEEPQEEPVQEEDVNTEEFSDEDQEPSISEFADEVTKPDMASTAKPGYTSNGWKKSKKHGRR